MRAMTRIVGREPGGREHTVQVGQDDGTNCVVCDTCGARQKAVGWGWRKAERHLLEVHGAGRDGGFRHEFTRLFWIQVAFSAVIAVLVYLAFERWVY